jgi:hypothetical protein
MPQLAGVSIPSPPDLGDHAELGADLGDRVAALVGVEVADEVVRLRADGLHHHARADGGAAARAGDP